MLKLGSTVIIKSLEWIDAQPKDADGDIQVLFDADDPHDSSNPRNEYIVSNMFEYAGKKATITDIGKSPGKGKYLIDIDHGRFNWTEEMFDNSPE